MARQPIHFLRVVDSSPQEPHEFVVERVCMVELFGCRVEQSADTSRAECRSRRAQVSDDSRVQVEQSECLSSWTTGLKTMESFCLFAKLRAKLNLKNMLRRKFNRAKCSI